jgi:hypothetical protein
MPEIKWYRAILKTYSWDVSDFTDKILVLCYETDTIKDIKDRFWDELVLLEEIENLRLFSMID